MTEAVELLSYHRGYYSALSDVEVGNVKVDYSQNPPSIHVTQEGMNG